MPSKSGTFGKLKWPVATMTWSKTSVRVFFARRSSTVRVKVASSSFHSTQSTAWANFT